MSAPQSISSYGRLPPELCQMILLHLDTRTLLTAATRVCRGWALLIRDSTELQQALFFVPDTRIKPRNKVHSPLLVGAFPSVFIKHQTGAYFEEYENRAYFENCDGLELKYFTLGSWDFIKNPEKQSAYLRPEASWRRMLVQQPPIYKIGVWIERYSMTGIETYSEIPNDLKLSQNGIRMETLFEQIVFNPDLALDCTRVIWQGHCSAMRHGKIKDLERSCDRKLDSGLILNSMTLGRNSGSSPAGMEEKEQAEKMSRDFKAFRAIEADYEKRGLRSQVEEEGWRTKMNFFRAIA